MTFSKIQVLELPVKSELKIEQNMTGRAVFSLSISVNKNFPEIIFFPKKKPDFPIGRLPSDYRVNLMLTTIISDFPVVLTGGPQSLIPLETKT